MRLYLPSMQSILFSASTIPLGQAHEYPATPTELSRQRRLQFPLFSEHGLLEAVHVYDAIPAIMLGYLKCTYAIL